MARPRRPAGSRSRKTISLEEPAYERLRKEKQPGETFSELIHRMFQSRALSLVDLGRLAEAEATKISVRTLAHKRRGLRKPGRQRS